MANIRKSFNFRNGVQVDDDNFIVNANGLVGIGTSIPTAELDVIGTVKVTGLITANNLYSNSTNITQLNIGVTSFTSGIITSYSGIVTYYGDGRFLQGLPTSQWLDIDVGLGFTSIYAQGNVGVATNDPRFAFQVGGNPNTQNGVGFNSTGSIVATGVITASSFSGNGSNITQLNASNISSGTLDNLRLPSNISVSGIITAQTKFVGNLVGFASTAYDVDSNAIITVNTINSTTSNSTNSTISNLVVNGNIGINSSSPQTDIEIRKSSGTSEIRVINSSSSSLLSLGRVSGVGNSGSAIQFGNTNGSYALSTQNSLDILNYDTGNINYYLYFRNSGINTGNFNWVYGQSSNPIMTLTYGGKLGLGIANPTDTLHIVGTSTVTSNSFVGGTLRVTSDTYSNNSYITSKLGIATSTVASLNTLQIGGDSYNSGTGIAARSSGNLKASGTIEAQTLKSTYIDVSAGIITAGIITSVNNLYATNILNVSGGTNIGQLSNRINNGYFNIVDISTLTAGSFSPTDLTVAGTLTIENLLYVDPAGSVGIRTDAPKSALDMSTAISVFYPPAITSTQRDGLTVYPGAIIFNTDTGRFQGYDGSNWGNF